MWLLFQKRGDNDGVRLKFLHRFSRKKKTALSSILLDRYMIIEKVDDCENIVVVTNNEKGENLRS
jgi:hypothetical protein